ncbi:MAG TPA: glutathione S-transferase family protein [Chakrabartia sp.]|jgi:glutathione S-transferase|nr:glutathione S-transferase family protein [Chakrabartia sp.]
MPELTLYHFPGACSQVTVCALEQVGLPYTLKLVNLAQGEQSTPEYLAISPLGKVPTMVADGVTLTENAALLVYLNALKPEAGLFPANPSPLMQSAIQAGLSFCGGTLHPQVRGILNPQRVTTGDGAPVREMATRLANKAYAYAEQRLAEKGWWLGEESIIDVYLNWTFSVARNGGFDTTPYPLLGGLADRLAARPAFVRTQAIEAESKAKLGL